MARDEATHPALISAPCLSIHPCVAIPPHGTVHSPWAPARAYVRCTHPVASSSRPSMPSPRGSPPARRTGVPPGTYPSSSSQPRKA